MVPSNQKSPESTPMRTAFTISTLINLALLCLWVMAGLNKMRTAWTLWDLILSLLLFLPIALTLQLIFTMGIYVWLESAHKIQQQLEKPVSKSSESQK